MKVFLVTIFLLSTFVSFAQLAKVRESYPKAADNHDIAKELHNTLLAITKEDNQTLVAYKGAVSTLMAKFAKGVKNKKEYFTTGAALIEKAVSTEPENIEIRCIRLSVQENSPKILKYKNDIEGDKQFLLENYKKTPSKEVKGFVKNFVLASSLFDDTEKQLF